MSTFVLDQRVSMSANAAPRVGAGAEPVLVVECTDEELALRAQLGEGDALASFGALVERYEARIVSFLSRRTGSRHDAEDLAQEAFVRAWVKIGTFDPSRRFSVWMFTVAARVAASEWRKAEDGRRRAAESGRRNVDSGDGGVSPRRGEVWVIAERVLEPETVSALWLRYVAGLEPGEIALVLGRTGVGVRVMLHRARKKLGEHLGGLVLGGVAGKNECERMT